MSDINRNPDSALHNRLPVTTSSNVGAGAPGLLGLKGFGFAYVAAVFLLGAMVLNSFPIGLLAAVGTYIFIRRMVDDKPRDYLLHMLRFRFGLPRKYTHRPGVTPLSAPVTIRESDGGERKARGYTLVEILIVATIIGILIAIGLPMVYTAHLKNQGRTCTANLVEIENAKDRWMADHPQQTIPNSAALLPYLMNNQLPVCPSGGTYGNLTSKTANATCSFNGNASEPDNKGLPATANHLHDLPVR